MDSGYQKSNLENQWTKLWTTLLDHYQTGDRIISGSSAIASIVGNAVVDQ